MISRLVLQLATEKETNQRYALKIESKSRASEIYEASGVNQVRFGVFAGDAFQYARQRMVLVVVLLGLCSFLGQLASICLCLGLCFFGCLAVVVVCFNESSSLALKKKNDTNTKQTKQRPNNKIAHNSWASPYQNQV